MSNLKSHNARWNLVTGIFHLARHNAINNFAPPGTSQIDYLTGKSHYQLWEEYMTEFENIIDTKYTYSTKASEFTAALMDISEFIVFQFEDGMESLSYYDHKIKDQYYLLTQEFDSSNYNNFDSCVAILANYHALLENAATGFEFGGFGTFEERCNKI